MGVSTHDSESLPGAPGPRGATRVDFDLHGLVGLRLIDPSPSDVAAARQQLGSPALEPLTREPDIHVRFVTRIPVPDLRWVEAQRSGFTERDFFLLSGSGGARVRIPFDTLGGACEIDCESGLGAIPLLMEAVKLAALRRGAVPLHASAFMYHGTGVLAVGWAHSGKTSALLAFAEQGAEYVGDDPVFLTRDGRRMLGIPASLDLTDWQLRQIPRVRHRVGSTRRLAFGGVGLLDRLVRGIPERVPASSRPVRLLRSAASRLQRRLRVRLPAEVVCPVVGSCAAEAGKLFCMVTHESPEIRVEPSDPEEMLQRMIQLARYEGLSLLRHYVAYRFAFPGRRNEFLESAHETEADLLRRALVGKEAYTVYHPRPVSLRELYEAMRPVCEVNPTAAATAAVGGARRIAT